MMRFIFSFLMTSITFFMIGCSSTIAKSEPEFQTVDTGHALILQKGDTKESCVICGMHLPNYYKTNHAAVTHNGIVRQYCSLHCLVYDNEINKTNLYDVKVVDTVSLKFISAQSAYYVVGSSKSPTMSHISKYAFEKRNDADIFAKKYGGNVMNFYDAYTVAMRDFTSGKE